MKKVLLIIGMIVITHAVLSLLFSALQGYGYYHLLDGDADMYIGMHRRMILFFVIGIVLAVVGFMCIRIRN